MNLSNSEMENKPLIQQIYKKFNIFMIFSIIFLLVIMPIISFFNHSNSYDLGYIAGQITFFLIIVWIVVGFIFRRLIKKISYK